MNKPNKKNLKRKNSKKIKIGITHGDINGIGYEVIIKTLLDNRVNELCTPIVYGSSKFVAYHKKAINVGNFSLNSIKIPEQANPKIANIINCIEDNVRIELGRSSETAGIASFQALESATNDLKNNKIDALITAPINKKNINSKEFSFPGHTEYLKSKFEAKDVLMLMVGDTLRLGVVTGHVPLKEVSLHITFENILKKIQLLNDSLIKDFKIRKPMIAVLGLNPHAGDEGIIGEEEQKIIIPAINEARKKGIMAIGPYAADGFFGSGVYKKFDAILSMYHDQGLTPFKNIEFETGVNYTAGLSVIRTSPAHGTAYDIAGKGIASPDSFRRALFLAMEIHQNRNFFKEININPLVDDIVTK